MKQKIIFVILLTLQFAYGQPGPYGADLSINLKNKSEKVKVYQVIDKKYNEIEGNGYYFINGMKSPSGGGVKGHIEIIKEKDTMKIQHPKSPYDEVVHLSVPFRKGNYIIPFYAYHLHRIFRPEFRKKLKPSLNGNWKGFEEESKSNNKIYARRKKIIRTNWFEKKEKHKEIYKNPPNPIKDWLLMNRKEYEKKIKLNSENRRLEYRKWYEEFYGFTNKKIHYLGVMNDEVYIYQEKPNSDIEYGRFKVCLYNKEKSAYEDLDVKFGTFIKAIKRPLIYGYYNGKKNGYYGMQGIFELYINPSKKELKTIIEEHNEDNY